MELNEKQKELLCKEFAVNEHFSICRYDYESFPCAMIAFTWTDLQMTELAEEIAKELLPYDDENAEGCEEDFWIEMESVAARKGMQYYEDLTDEQEKEMRKKWAEIK